jgi:hypothetical protein
MLKDSEGEGVAAGENMIVVEAGSGVCNTNVVSGEKLIPILVEML